MNLENTTKALGAAEFVLMSKLISDELTEILNTVNLASFSAVVAMFGIFANIINIVVFLKNGFSDTVNVSLFSLAICDLCSLLTVQWVNLLRNPLFFKSGVPFIITEVFHLTGGWPHAFSARMTSWITAYITLERCLCVLIPLKVKLVITPKFAVSILVSIFLVMLLTLIPDYSTAHIGWTFVAEKNRSLLGLIFTGRRSEMAALSFTLSAYTQIISFTAVIGLTVTLVLKMKQMSRWRMSTTSLKQNSNKESFKRDNKVVSMIILIAVIYTICFLPMMVNFMTVSLVPEFSIVGRYQNSFLVAWSFAFLADTINSSVNIFIYYKMSTKYRATFHSIFQRRERQ